MLATVPSRILTEWQAYFRLEPFGPWAENLNTGRIITTIRSLFKKKGSPPEKAEDNSLGEYKPPLYMTRQSTDTQIMKIHEIAKAFGAKIVKRNKEDE